MKNLARGGALARAVIARAKEEAAAAEQQLGRTPLLAIVATDDRDGHRFVQLKRDALAGIALAIESVWLDSRAGTGDATRAIHELNARQDVDAIFLQFPLPADVDVAAASNAVAIDKDIDASGDDAEAAFHEGEFAFTPVAPHAALDLLADQLGSLQGRRIVLCGSDDPFVRVLQTLLKHAQVHVLSTDSAARDTIAADAMVIAEAEPASQLMHRIETLDVMLDAGYYLPPRPTDWIPQSAAERVAVHLTQYGNVGPLTVAHLARATIRAATLDRG